MNAERLLAHFDTISEAPDAVARLRRFILDLAVRGKLVEQDPEDQDKTARERLVEFAESCSLIPGSWLYVPLACLLAEDTRNGYSRKPDDAEDGFPILRISAATARPDGLVDEGEFKLISGIDEVLASQYAVQRGDLLACRFNGNKAYVGRLSLFMGYSGKQFIYPDKLIRVRLAEWLAEPAFFRCISNSDLVREEVEEKCATTVGNWGISAGKLKTCMFPIPPLAEQHRIVAKVDELMALCDQLEAARQEREQSRERLVAASLQRLNQPAEVPASFRQNAQFALEALPSLTTTPAQIKQLRQAILSLAVRGKLVEQDPEDEPAEAYLRLINAKPAERGDFCLPRQWAWVSVGEVSTSRLGKMLDKAKNKGTERPYLRNINVRWLDFDLSDLLEMKFEDSELAKYELRKGDVLVCEGGEPGRAAVWDDRARDIYFQKAIHRVRFDECVYPLFFVHALRCSAQDERLSRYFTGTGISHFTGKSLKAYLFPLPPLAEQHRIVAKVDELMALCDQLEQQLSQAGQQRRQLLEAVLAEALDGRLAAEDESHADVA